jgi:hypothetical protein
MAQSITYSTILDCQQRIAYGAGGYQTTDGNGNTVYYPCALYTDIKTQGSDGSVRDTQIVNPKGNPQSTPFTPQQIYTIINSSNAGPILAADLKTAFNDATATVVS